MSRYDAWLVDLDGTLYRTLPVKIAMACELFIGGLGAVKTLQSFRREHERIREEVAAATVRTEGTAGTGEGVPIGDTPSPYEQQVARAARALAREPAEVERLVVEWMHERPGKWIRLFSRKPLLAEIRAFRAAGGKTALVSDYPALAKLRALGDEPLFDVVVASGEPGGPARLKPDPAGYLSAAERLGVPADRCLVLGDRPDADGAAARAAGMAFRRI